MVALSSEIQHPLATFCADVPEDLAQSLQIFLESHPKWDDSRVFTAALAQFLSQQGVDDTCEAELARREGYRRASSIYLDAMFR